MATPRPWPEGTIPASDELTDWFLAQPHDEQVAIMSIMLNDARVAAACWQQDHGGIIATLEALERRVVELQAAGLLPEDRSVGITLATGDDYVDFVDGTRLVVHTTEAAEVVVEHGLATTYADYLVDEETAGSPKPSGYCVDSMVSGPADHTRCEGRGHLGQPCGCTCHDQEHVVELPPLLSDPVFRGDS